ncbi:hypothetical protein PFISCL1PPCAC_20834, partial [Pristionchus fissidentatus]
VMAYRSQEVDESGGMKPQQFIVLLGSDAVNLGSSLRNVIGGSSTNTTLCLKTKYYSTEVNVMSFATLNQFISWKEKSAKDDFFIGALFAKVQNDMDQLLNEFYVHKLTADDLKIESNAMVLSSVEKMGPLGHEKMVEWCNKNDFEVVHLENTQAAMDEAAERNEKTGLLRLEELLHVVDWPCKTIFAPRMTGNQRFDSVVETLNGMSDSEDEGLMPSESDQAGIAEFFALKRPSSTAPPARTSPRLSYGSSGSGTSRVAEASVDVNVALHGGITVNNSTSTWGPSSLVSPPTGSKRGKETGEKGAGGKGKNKAGGSSTTSRQQQLQQQAELMQAKQVEKQQEIIKQEVYGQLMEQSRQIREQQQQAGNQAEGGNNQRDPRSPTARPSVHDIEPSATTLMAPIARVEDDEAEEETTEDEKRAEIEGANLATMLNSVREIRALSKPTGGKGGESSSRGVDGMLGLMDKVCKEMLGEEGLLEEVMRIERERQMGTYSRKEDSD